MKEVQHATPDMAVEKIPFADIAFAQPQFSREERSGGTMLVRSMVLVASMSQASLSCFGVPSKRRRRGHSWRSVMKLELGEASRMARPEGLSMLWPRRSSSADYAPSGR